MNLSRRRFLGVSAGWAALLLAGCGQAAAPASPSSSSGSRPAEPASGSASSSGQPAASAAPSAKVSAPGRTNAVKGAWVAITANQMLWPLALEAGYFDKYGVNFSLQYVQGSLTSVQSLLAGDLQMVEVAGSAVVAAQATKTDLVMTAGFLNQAVWRIMGVPSIKTVEDLKGKTVAISKVGNADYFAWSILAQHENWPEDSFKFVAANNPPGQVALLNHGDAAATAVSPPNDVLAEEKGNAHLVVDETKFNVPEQQVGMALLASYLAQNRQTALNVLKATVEAIHRWKTDAAFAKQVIAKYLKETDQRYVDSGYSAYAPLFPEEPYPSTEGFAGVIKEVATQRPSASSVTPQQCMDTSLVKELVDSGFIKQVYGH
ncbi:MAG TPA: ABC transporter substrate-binding protein [Chloroflexota bacterium]|nr:ABC transporter substrate-binding protein [Chloroflexota bacterium]